MAIQTLTQITLQQLVNLDSNPITAGKYPKYTVNLGFSISNITASELAGAVDNAQKSAAAAKVSETNAKTSETNAKDSETKAKTSETNAKDSETKAKASETAAKTSETNAKDSETKSKASETAAKTSETNAKDSETKAKTSETNAKASETAAKTSETNAKDSETKAKTSETNAKDSETKAKVSETNAKASEDAADVSEANALASELAAKASEGAAKTSETNAKTSETNAKTSETNAASSEEVAVDSAAAAKVSEDAAKLSETNAKTSETNAAESETNAADSAVKAKTEADRAQDISDNLPTKEMFLAYTKLYDTHQEALDDLQYRTVGEKVLIWDETPAAYGWFDVVENDGVKELQLDRNELKIKSINNVRPDAAGNVQITLPGGNPSLWLGETVWFPYDPSGTIGYSGVLPQDGRLVLRADYPDAWLAISQGLVPSVSDEEWLAGAQTVFSTGDGSTNFRLPKWDGEVLRAPTDGDTIGSKFDQIPYVTSINGIGPDEATGNVVIDLTSYAKKGVNNDITNLTGLTSSIRLGADGSNPLEAVTLKQMQQAIAAISSAGGINGVMSTFIGDVSWWQGSASLLPTGYVNPVGQLSLRSDFPEIWALIDSGALTSTTEANWNSTTNLGYRGMFTKGTVTSGDNANFRWPDLNGATTNAIQGLFLRGAATGKQSGEIRASAIPNLIGEAAINLSGVANIGVQLSSGGVFADRQQVTNLLQSASGIQASGSGNTGFKFDASRASNVYQNAIDEVRPPSVSGLWIMRAKGTFSAQTSFGVFTSQATAPATGAVAYGGDIGSVLQVGGSDYFKASLRTQVIGGGERSLRLRLIDSASGTLDEIKVARTSITLPEAGGTGSSNNRNGGNFRSETAQSYGQLRAYRNNADGGLVFQISQDGAEAKNFYMTGLGNFVMNGAMNSGTVNSNGTITGYVAISGSPANGSFLNAPGMVSRLDDRCYAVMYSQENVGVSHQIIFNLNGFNTNYDWRFVAGGRIDTPLGVVATQGSDVRLKNNIVESMPGHKERISKVGVVEFTMKGTGERERGFIAQQLDTIDKMYTFESQITQSIRDEETGEIISSDSKPIMNVRDRALMADLIATVQDLLKEVADLKQEVASLRQN